MRCTLVFRSSWRVMMKQTNASWKAKWLNGSKSQCGWIDGPLLDVDPTGKPQLFCIARGVTDPPLTTRKFRPCHPLLSF